MFQLAIQRLLTCATLAAALGMTVASFAAPSTPTPQALLEAMQQALIPSNAQFARVHISTHSDQPGGGTKTWDALVIRERDEQGPRTALSLVTPPVLNGAGMLTAPHPTKSMLGLWLYSPGERRAIEVSPLDADRQFLTTQFNFEDLAMTKRVYRRQVLLGSEHEGQRQAWKIESQPDVDRYYSRILTWIAADTYLPIKREYYDRADRLWKVVTYGERLIENIPTVVSIELRDVQSRDISEWKIEAVGYAHEKLAERVLSPAGLGVLQQHSVWQRIGANGKNNETVSRSK